jgi:hypothetical protein
MNAIGAAALGCATCFGDPNSPLTQAAKGGVLVMLGVVAFVLGGVAAVAIYWAKRARMLEGSKEFDARPRLTMRPR